MSINSLPCNSNKNINISDQNTLTFIAVEQNALKNALNCGPKDRPQRQFCHKSFSLVELMVVVTIIAILSAMAVQQYSKFVIKARIADGMMVLDKVNHVIAEYYAATNLIPNSDIIEVNAFGTSQPSGNNGYITPNSPNVAFVWTNNYPYMPNFYYQLTFPFQAPSGGGDTAYMTVQNVNGLLVFYCGVWNSLESPGAFHITDVSNLPKGCDCTWIANATTVEGGSCYH